MNNNELAIWYSITRDTWVNYYWFYKSIFKFSYYKINPISSWIQEIYVWADERLNKQELIKLFNTFFCPELNKKIFESLETNILAWKVSEIHYSIDSHHNDTTFYIYSEDISYISFLYTELSKTSFDVPFSFLDIKSYCLKIKKHQSWELYYSVVYTSKNFDNKKSFKTSFSNNLKTLWLTFFDETILQNNSFFTYEFSVTCKNTEIENFTLFKFPRYK